MRNDANLNAKTGSGQTGGKLARKKLRCCAFDLGCCKGQVDTAGAVEGRVYPRGATQNRRNWRLSTPVSHSERMNMYYAKTGSGQTSWRNMLRKAQRVFRRVLLRSASGAGRPRRRNGDGHRMKLATSTVGRTTGRKGASLSLNSAPMAVGHPPLEMIPLPSPRQHQRVGLPQRTAATRYACKS